MQVKSKCKNKNKKKKSTQSAQSAWSAQSAVCSLHGLRFGVTVYHLTTKTLFQTCVIVQANVKLPKT